MGVAAEKGGPRLPAGAAEEEVPGARETEERWRSRGGRKTRYTFHGSPEEERELIRSALERLRGNRSRVARELGMARNTLRDKLKKYGLDASGLSPRAPDRG
jgi:DNA-binding NtrC family response regulator